MLGSFFSILGGAGYFWGKGLNDIAKRDAGEAYLNAQGYNRDRQWYLDSLVYSTVPEERMKFCRLVGRHVFPTGRDLSDGSHIDEDRDRMLALRQIALKEGWKYYDSGDLLADPVYTKLTGMKCNPNINSLAPDWDAIAQELNEETARKEVWKDRCKHGHEVDVFPMDFGSEYNYQCAVRSEYYAWRRKYATSTDLYTDFVELKGIRSTEPKDYETEEEFLEAAKKEEEYYSQFQVYRELESKRFFYFYLNTVESAWGRLKEDFSDELSISDMRKFLYEVTIGSVDEESADRYLRIAKDKLTILGYLTPENEKELEPYLDPSIYPIGIPRSVLEAKAEAAAAKERADRASEYLTKLQEKNRSISQPIKEHPSHNPIHPQFTQPITAIGKTYTIQRGNRKSRLTLTKGV